MHIIAHRGASHFAPENTIAAFKQAIQLHADGIELDVRTSKDGEIVLSHDATIKRMTNKKGWIHDLTLQQLQTYDFGKSFSRQYKGEQIASLYDVLKLIQTTNLFINIELKSDHHLINDNLTRKTVEMVQSFQMQNRVIYSSFNHYILQSIHLLDQDSKLCLLFPKNFKDDIFTYIDQIPFPLYGIHPHYTSINDTFMDNARKRNLIVNTYTVNHKRTANKLKKLKVDGIITDIPNLLTK